jgi:hypothetical protein
MLGATGTAVAIGVVVIVVGAARAPAGASASDWPPGPLVLSRFAQMATGAANGEGEANPTAAEIFDSTRDRVLNLIGTSDSGPERPVYLITVRGNFVDASGPSFSAAATGKVFLIAVDQETGEVLITALLRDDSRISGALGRKAELPLTH